MLSRISLPLALSRAEKLFNRGRESSLGETLSTGSGDSLSRELILGRGLLFFSSGHIIESLSSTGLVQRTHRSNLMPSLFYCFLLPQSLLRLDRLPSFLAGLSPPFSPGHPLFVYFAEIIWLVFEPSLSQKLLVFREASWRHNRLTRLYSESEK